MRTVFVFAATGLAAAALLAGSTAAAGSVSSPSTTTTTATRVAVGNGYACLVTSGGAVKCWGENSSGRLGTGDFANSATPADVVGLASGVTAITVGGGHACAITRGGVKCWGANGAGQLGNGTLDSSPTPVDVSGLTSGVTAIAAGGSHTCAVTGAGALKCWGDNYVGQLGDGTLVNSSTPVQVSGLTTGVTAVATGDGQTCAVASSGVKCWGDNFFGELGDGTKDNRSTPVDVSGLAVGVTDVAAGTTHTCALTSGGAAQCWGGGWNGQLGDGTGVGSLTPVAVSGLTSGVTAIAAGTMNTCALTAGGAKCWGANFYGQVGDGTGGPGSTVAAPVDVAGLTSGVSAIAAGGDDGCAVASGTVKCWGANTAGQLGDGTAGVRTTPGDVAGLTGGVAAIAAGGTHACALTSAGGIKCWGDNLNGQLGDGTKYPRLTPVGVAGLSSGVASIAAGMLRHTCALTTAGAVKCWGANDSGQLGDGTLNTRLTPADVSGLGGGVAAITAGADHSCALTTGGAVKCWGANASGQLGDGTQENRSTPVNVSGLTAGVTAIAGGGAHTCALTNSGAVKCWGANDFGQLGDGTHDMHLTPVDVSGLTKGVTAIATGAEHTCAIASGGGLKCWGSTASTTPTDVSGLTSGVTDVAAGPSQTCAVTSAGAAKCWGSVPTDVTGLGSGVASITVAGGHTCALMTAGGVKCWGTNLGGQLGDGRPSYRTRPVTVIGFGVIAADLRTLTVFTEGPAAGTVTSQPPDIDCGAEYDGVGGPACAIDLVVGSQITLTTQGPNFVGWSGACSGTGSCAVTMDQARSVTATFSPAPKTLTVTRDGRGAGSVSSSPAGIDCGSTCTASFGDGAQVVLTATPAAGSTFSGWSGACFGFGTCTLTMSQFRFVTASFALVPGTPKTLSVAKDGSGAGSVSVVYSGGLSDCLFSTAGGTCSRTFANGTRVILSPTPAAGSTFAGWSGDCSGTVSCTLTMDQNHSVTAAFALAGNPPGRKTLTVAKTGAGTVTSTPGGIDCGATCARDFDQGIVVTLTATPATGSTFAGWSGDCSGGAATCMVTMEASRSATANFQASSSPPLRTQVKCAVPNVKGKTLAVAKRTLARANCSLGKVTRSYSTKVKKGLVISQKPSARRSLAKGAKISLVVSKGKHR
jgi:alpha-tubulin suppressor-like RCC1 family protein